MGRKVNPIGYRLAVQKDWRSKWYASEQEYTKFLHEDLKVRSYLKKKLYTAALSKIQIERAWNSLRVTLFTARPGLVIGRKGAEIEIMSSKISAMEFGSPKPKSVAILTGSGQSAVDQILKAGTDTLITGELKQQHFNLAQELQLNLYACGHYATETFAVEALAMEVASQFSLPYQFIETDCPL